MKILCLADIHVRNKNNRKQKFHWIDKKIKETNPDVIVIAGDIFENDQIYNQNPYMLLSDLTDNKIPIVCVFGNHEFVYHTLEQVHNKYKELYEPEKYNVHYLDICGHYDVGDVRFVGNILWYDGSLKCYEDQNLYDWGYGGWLDRLIVDFNIEESHQNCVQQIKKNIDPNKTNILVTHCVPHIDLNGHPRNSVFNAFSGVDNLLKDIDVKYSISGHTHMRIIGLEREGTMCLNVGNDYDPPYEYFLLEV